VSVIDWRRLFPPVVVGALLVADLPPDPLHPDEEAYLAARGMRGRREDDFRRGRTCARRALNGLGLAALPILPSSGRDPIWPSGVVGSITHAEGLAAAAVAMGDQILGLGLDAERLDRAGADLVPLIASAEEALLWSSAWGGRDWLTALFSAKEAVFKATFPRTRQFLEFHDVVLTPTIDGQGFSAASGPGPTKSPALAHLTGRVVFQETHVVTSAWWRGVGQGE
jgi:4'-phosphopantetheinyl transferase EntD